MAITGPGTAWPGPQSGSSKTIRDPSNTILLVEVADPGFHWMEPRDRTLDEVLADPAGLAGVITSYHALSDGYFVRRHRAGGFVLTADGGVHYLDGRPSPEDLADLLRVDGPKRVRIDKLILRDGPLLSEQIRWDHVVGLPLFLISLLLLVTRPLPKRREPPTEGTTEKERTGQDSQDLCNTTAV